eukprot:UN04073
MSFDVQTKKKLESYMNVFKRP